METVELPVQLRLTKESPRSLRSLQMIPGVVYGRAIETKTLKMPYKSFRKVFEKAAFSTLLNLQIEGQEKIPTLIHEVQYHPVTDNILHVDFYAVRMDEKVKTHVSIEFFGLSEAVKQGAILQTTLHEVEISCLPKDLVHHIKVDLAALQKLGDTIRVGDLPAPPGVEILNRPEEPVVSAVELKIVEEVPAVSEVAAIPAADGTVAPAPEAGKGTEEKAVPEKPEKGKS